MDIGSTTPIINDEYSETAHPNSPITTPLTQVPQAPAQTKEILTRFKGCPTPLTSIPEDIPVPSADEIKTQTIVQELAAQIPWSAAT